MKWMLFAIFIIIVIITCLIIDFVPSGVLQTYGQNDLVSTDVHILNGSMKQLPGSTVSIPNDHEMVADIFPANVTVRDAFFNGVQVRIYRPINMKGTLKGVMYYHGGGWVRGDTYRYDPLIADVMKKTYQIVIVSVNYRLAPEYKFPVPLEDCIIATKYFIENAKEFNVDSNRIVISGDSAGGNLAAAVALKLRDEKFTPLPTHQILIYPVLQGLDLALPSYVQNADERLTREFMALIISQYATGSSEYQHDIERNLHVSPEARKDLFNSLIPHSNVPKEYQYAPYTKPDLNQGKEAIWNKLKDIITNPYFSPLMAKDLAGLPETFVFTSQFDVLRDESLLYIQRLRDAGVTVTHIHGTNNTHGTCSRSMQKGQREECVSTLVTFINKAVI